jgi:hypothetical protein
MEPAAIIREWSRRRRSLEIVHNVCAVGILGTLVGTGVLDSLGIVGVPVWARIAVVAALVIVDLAYIYRVCRCPSCGRYPGGGPTPSGRPTRMVPFGWAVCLKCLVALRDD